MEKPKVILPELADFWGGYKIEFKVIETEKAKELEYNINDLRRQAEEIDSKHRRIFRIEISKYEFCSLREDHELDDYTIYVYPPILIVLEKIRAICQQNSEYVKNIKKNKVSRARDFFDIFTVMKNFKLSLNDNLDLLTKVFEAKHVPLNLLYKIEEDREFHFSSFPALKDTIRPNVKIKDFDFYFEYVIGLLNKLHPFGIK
jgi:hypothetical protein